MRSSSNREWRRDEQQQGLEDEGERSSSRKWRMRDE
jgi:hypothetical protein